METLTGSIYFLGHYRPFHCEDTALAKVLIRLRHAASGIEDRQLHAWIEERIAHCGREIKRNPAYSSVSSDHSDRGVSICRRPHDPWLDKVTADLPPCPGLNYSA